MRTRPFAIVLSFVLSVFVFAACSEETPPSPTDTRHAPASAVPGSHADWCAEHEVPESMCTRCNPDLVPAFQATGDWCDEHGLPESQCRACNPDLVIERPAPEET